MISAATFLIARCKVDNPPCATFAGHDYQLEAALLHLKDAIAAAPLPAPVRPAPVVNSVVNATDRAATAGSSSTTLASKAADIRAQARAAQRAEDECEVVGVGSSSDGVQLLSWQVGLALVLGVCIGAAFQRKS